MLHRLLGAVLDCIFLWLHYLLKEMEGIWFTPSTRGTPETVFNLNFKTQAHMLSKLNVIHCVLQKAKIVFQGTGGLLNSVERQAQTKEILDFQTISITSSVDSAHKYRRTRMVSTEKSTHI